MGYHGLIDGVGVSNLQTQINSKADTTNLGIAKAWVRFDGSKDTTGASSTANTARQILASHNVTSVMRTATGNYTINFTTAMADTSYTVIGSSANASSPTLENILIPQLASITTSSVAVYTRSGGGTANDASPASVAIFR